MTTPEQRARQTMDDLLTAAGWQVQDRVALDLSAGCGVAVREFPLKMGFADYLLFVDRKAIGAVEAKAKAEGVPLSGIESQTEKYGAGLPDVPPAWRKPLPFLYESTGVETFFTNGLDPDPRSRRTFAFHRPETLAGWVGGGVQGKGNEGWDYRVTNNVGRGVQLNAPTTGIADVSMAQPGITLRGRLRRMPALNTTGLWSAQVEAVTNLERSLAEGRPRAPILCRRNRSAPGRGWAVRVLYSFQSWCCPCVRCAWSRL
jgi:type I restriction enzyme, R subunit